jgi:glutamate dehydrogenase
MFYKPDSFVIHPIYLQGIFVNMKNPVTESLISTLKKLSRLKISESEVEYLRTYYHRLSRQDFDLSKASEFRAAALRHRKLGRVRKPNDFIIDIENIKPSGNGEHSQGEFSIIYMILGDQPFVINSMLMKLNALHRSPSRVVHPIFEVRRNDSHRATRYKKLRSDGSPVEKDIYTESYIQFAVDYIPEAEQREFIAQLRQVIDDINVIVKGWTAMRDKVLENAALVETVRKGPVFAEYGELFRWMADDHFAIMGYGELEATESGKSRKIKIDTASLQGCLKSASDNGVDILASILPPITFSGTAPVVFTKARIMSHIHRAGYMDCMLIDHGFGTESKKRKISCILGFQAGSTATIPTTDIPHLRKKTSFVLETSTLRKSGHAYKELRTILETLPRDKLFHMDAKSLYGLSMTLLNQERRKTRLHIHKNVCGHFYSCLVYVPRDLFNSQLRSKIQSFLSDQLQATETEFDVYFSNSILTRIHYILHVNPSHKISVDNDALEKSVQKIARDWNDNLFEQLKDSYDRDTAKSALAKFHDAFPVSYQQDFSIGNAITDISIFEQVAESGVQARLTHSVRPSPIRSNPNCKASFKIYCTDIQIALSDVLPILENMGIRIHSGRPYLIEQRDGTTFRVLDFEITRLDEAPFSFKEDISEFEETFIQCWIGNIENDGYNQLTLLAGLSWRRINMIRAYYRYLKQIRLRYSENYIIDSLNKNPALVKTISQLFGARFDPRRKKSGVRKFSTQIKKQLQQVHTLDEERIVRALLDVIDSTLRTNYFQPLSDGSPKSYISFKLNSTAIPRIPEPAPKYEIFVYSPRVEGVHLRGGDVARGGLRWSERPEDFRTEILGLVKAQRVKNAVIVPVGSKGGFVAKQLPESGRDEILNEVIACYKIFISSLLDLTDNISGSRIIPPKNVIRLDGDDPYLVVAADKGTATFSDIANEISEAYGFWLGDAFASGGSAGYDHKKMGITARGAWESVKRHFRELGKNIQKEPFSVVGIGDMGGDVFGNGMLLSEQIRLLAAFNHMHIFIDPTPDTAASFEERQRLFNLPRSSWSDYDTALISRGGGVYSRSDKSITLSPQAKKALGIKQDALAPDDLINQLLKSDVELLWNGGIGTYVKASSETDSDAQDRNNDTLRVSANELKCKVIGEGGNLGMTQLGRIEYASRGGLCYTDAIDNSAGVDTSDHEVNIKILLNQEMNTGKLTFKQRNVVLAKMEKEIGKQVLSNNYQQTQILSIEAEKSNTLMPQQTRSIEMLEDSGLLHREIEFLPDSKTLKERFENKKYLTRPELAVLLSYSKMDLYQKMLNTKFPDEKYLGIEIDHYFPALITRSYRKQAHNHRLRREIIATQVTNDLVGNMGTDFHLRMSELTGASTHTICNAYIAAREILDNGKLNKQIQILDNRVKADVQMECLGYSAATTESSVIWILNNMDSPVDIKTLVKGYASGFSQLMKNIDKIASDSIGARFDKTRANLTSSGVPNALAGKISSRLILANGLDIVEISHRSDKSALDTGSVYFGVSESLGIEWLERQISSLQANNIWHQRARFSLMNELRSHHSRIVSDMLSTTSKKSAHGLLENWRQNSGKTIKSMDQKIRALKREQAIDFSMLSVLVSELNHFK